jgi:hypothetical protein
MRFQKIFTPPPLPLRGLSYKEHGLLILVKIQFFETFILPYFDYCFLLFLKLKTIPKNISIKY